MSGEGSKYIKDCLENNYIGANFLKDTDLSEISNADEIWLQLTGKASLCPSRQNRPLQKKDMTRLRQYMSPAPFQMFWISALYAEASDLTSRCPE